MYLTCHRTICLHCIIGIPLYFLYGYKTGHLKTFQFAINVLGIVECLSVYLNPQVVDYCYKPQNLLAYWF